MVSLNELLTSKRILTRSNIASIAEDANTLMIIMTINKTEYTAAAATG